MSDSFLNNPYFNPPSSQPTVIQRQVDSPQVDGTAGSPNMEMKKGFTSIIIPAYFMNYSLFHYTGHCIGSVREHTDMTKTPYEIILIINGKTGITFDNLEQTHADKVISNEENKGYGAAMNQGLRIATGEYVVFLSNDVLVFDHWLEDVQEALQHKDLIMATPMYGMPFARSVESMTFRENWMNKPIEDSFSDFRDFSCAAAKKSLFDEVGAFDEGFFVYKEDVDLLKRLQKANKTFSSSKRINTYHIIGATSTNMSDEELHKEEGKKHFEEIHGV